MTRRMTKRETRRYEERIKEEEKRQKPNRNREFVKVLGILSTNWAQHTALFTEKVKIVGKELYSVDKCKGNKDVLYDEGYVKEDNKVGTLLVDYGTINYGYIRNEEEGIVPVYCKKNDFDNYKIGDTITVYVYWSRGYDGTYIDLYLYNRWENIKPKITFTFL